MKTFKFILSISFYTAFALLMSFAIFLELLPRLTIPPLAKLFICFVAFSLLIAGTILMVNRLDDERRKQKAVKITIWIMFSIYLMYLISLLFFDRSFGRMLAVWRDYVYFKDFFYTRTNFIPFRTILIFIRQINNGQLRNAVINIFGNLAAFAPFGVFLPVLSRKCRKFLRFALIMLGLLIGVELLQLLLMTGSCDIDDVILNFIGAIAVFWILKIGLIQKLLAKFRMI